MKEKYKMQKQFGMETKNMVYFRVLSLYPVKYYKKKLKTFC